jgi:hypothetical protein
MGKKTLKASSSKSRKGPKIHRKKFCNCTSFCHKKLTLKTRKHHYKIAGRPALDSEESDSDNTSDVEINSVATEFKYEPDV